MDKKILIIINGDGRLKLETELFKLEVLGALEFVKSKLITVAPLQAFKQLVNNKEYIEFCEKITKQCCEDKTND